MKRSLPTRPRTTRNLVLRPFRRRDADSLYESASDSLTELNQWLPWAHLAYSRSDAGSFIRESMAAWQEGRAFDFAIRQVDDLGRHVGNVSVWFTSRHARVGEIGYWVRTADTSGGVCTEAVARALEVAFEELDMHRVTLRIAVGNLGSERVAEKLRFSREGLLREEVLVNSQWVDHSLWGLLEHAYRLVKHEYVAAGYL